MDSAYPTTAEYVRFHARHRPGQIALIEGARGVEYASFDRDLARMTRALRRFGMPRGSFVGVACEGLYLHWLLLLACESLGLVTASFLAGERSGLPEFLSRMQFVLSKGAVPVPAGPKWHRLTPEWIASVQASPASEPGDEEGLAPVAPGAAQRIRRTSGTTGGPKMMAATREVEERRIVNHIMGIGFTPQSRLLVSSPFTVGSIYAYATACLRLGATCIGTGKDLASEIVAHRPTHVRLYPFAVKSLLDQLPADFRRPDDLTAILGAAPLDESLRKRILDRLASRLIYLYSVNEVGTVAAIGDDGLGTLRPDVKAEVVDTRGVPVPPGHEGRLRVSTPLMVDGYIGDPEASARSFHNGWFHTGDAATLLPSGRLRLAGRSDEVLNIGGLKITPAQIEEIAAQSAALEDVGVISRPNAEGIEEACVAMVLRDPGKLKEAGAAIRKQFPPSFGRMHFVAVRKIPRTAETGKIRRAELKKQLAPK
jgi:acyl-coenzyme A synthetase/AMP-(fatty) acid ligase